MRNNAPGNRRKESSNVLQKILGWRILFSESESVTSASTQFNFALRVAENRSFRILRNRHVIWNLIFLFFPYGMWDFCSVYQCLRKQMFQPKSRYFLKITSNLSELRGFRSKHLLRQTLQWDDAYKSSHWLVLFHGLIQQVEATASAIMTSLNLIWSDLIWSDLI